MSISNNVFPFKGYFLQIADFPADVSRMYQHRADALMEICPELLKDNVVQKKKVEIRSSEAMGQSEPLSTHPEPPVTLLL